MLEDLSKEELLKIMARDRQVKGELTERLGNTLAECAELRAIVTELDSEVATLRELTAPAADSTDV